VKRTSPAAIANVEDNAKPEKLLGGKSPLRGGFFGGLKRLVNGFKRLGTICGRYAGVIRTGLRTPERLLSKKTPQEGK